MLGESMTIPPARRSEVLVEDLGDEVLAYDQRSHRAHRLKGPAVVVWRHADGVATAVDLAGRSGLRPAALTAAAELASLDLLELDAVEKTSRRKWLRRVPLAASAALPAVVTPLAPTPAEAASSASLGQNCSTLPCCSGLSCQLGVCMPI
jgi:hypothetical protein